MDEDSKSSSEIQVMGTDNIVNTISDSAKVEEEEAAMEREFIKVEKESFDLKDSSDGTEIEATEEEHHRPSVVGRSPNISLSSRDMLEAEEKAKELELELERVVGQLKRTESEHAALKEEVFVTKEKLENTEKRCEDLEVNQIKMQEQILEAEEKYISQEKALQEALQTHESKHKELIDTRELSDGITAELEISKKRMQELELELQSSSVEAQKFEELSRQSGLHAETETQRAIELERSLELAKSVATEMEDQMSTIQKEVKGLYEKIAENQRLEDALSAVQGEMELSKSHILELQQRLTSEEAAKNDLTQELDLHKVSEEQMKVDILALENLYLPTKQDLQAKISELEEMKMALAEHLKTKEIVDISINEKEELTKNVEKKLEEVTGEKIVLEAAVADLHKYLEEMKELCNETETKLKLSDENFLKADSLLSEALSNNLELEQKLKSIEDLHQESTVFATTASDKNVELEDIVRASNAAAEEVKLQLRDVETDLISVKQKSVELEQQLNLVELEKSHAEREVTEKTIEFNSILGVLGEEKKLLQSKIQECEEKLTGLESSLADSSSRTIELEKELKDVQEKCIEHEGRVGTAHQRSLELEDLVQISHSKAEDVGKKYSDLELLMEASNNRITEMEEQIRTLETKCLDKELESQKVFDKTSVLASELEIFRATASDLEIALRAAKEKEVELMDRLNEVMEERKKAEDMSKSSVEKILETEKTLKLLQEEHEALEQDFKLSGIREAEVMEKLKSSEEQLHQAMERNSELESQCKFLKSDISESLIKVVALESAVDEHKSKALEAENRTGQSFSENEMLAETNLQLKNKINELEELLDSACAEKEATSQQLALHIKSIAELTDQNSKSLEFHSVNESRIKEAETQLEEAIQKFTQRDLEVIELSEKLNELEAKLKIHEDKAIEALTLAESRKGDLDENHIKMKNLEEIVQELQSKAAQLEKESEGLAETNLKLSQELMAYESNMSELRSTLSKSLADNDATLGQLQMSKKTVEELTQQLAFEGEKLQSQLSSIMEENNIISETYQDARKELEAVIVQLEGRLNQQKATEENLKADLEIMKAELAKKTAVQALADDLEHQLQLAEARLKEEVNSVLVAAAKKEDEKLQQLQEKLDLAHTTIVKQDEEVKKLTVICQEMDDRKSSLTASLEKHVEKLENDIKLKNISSQDQDNVSEIGLKDGADVKSRDLGSSISTPSKRKSKKRSESQTSPSSEVLTQKTEVSSGINYKSILGVALISIILGIILGKRY